MKPRRLASPEEDDDVLTEFCAMLIDALQIAEVRTALADAVAAEQFRRDMWATRKPPASTPARGQAHHRGQ